MNPKCTAKTAGKLPFFASQLILLVHKALRPFFKQLKGLWNALNHLLPTSEYLLFLQSRLHELIIGFACATGAVLLTNTLPMHMLRTRILFSIQSLMPSPPLFIILFIIQLLLWSSHFFFFLPQLIMLCELSKDACTHNPLFNTQTTLYEAAVHLAKKSYQIGLVILFLLDLEAPLTFALFSAWGFLKIKEILHGGHLIEFVDYFSQSLKEPNQFVSIPTNCKRLMMLSQCNPHETDAPIKPNTQIKARALCKKFTMEVNEYYENIHNIPLPINPITDHIPTQFACLISKNGKKYNINGNFTDIADYQEKFQCDYYGKPLEGGKLAVDTVTNANASNAIQVVWHNWQKDHQKNLRELGAIPSFFQRSKEGLRCALSVL